MQWWVEYQLLDKRVETKFSSWTKRDSNAQARIIGVKILTKSGEKSKQCSLQSFTAVPLICHTVDSVVNWCHFELLSSFLEMRIPPYIQTYNKMESNISDSVTNKKYGIKFLQLLFEQHFNHLFCWKRWLANMDAASQTLIQPHFPKKT